MASLSQATAFLFDGGTPASRNSSPIAGGNFEVRDLEASFSVTSSLQLRADEMISRLFHLDFPVPHQKIPVSISQGISHLTSGESAFFHRQVVDHPLNLRNSRFFSLIDGN